VSGATTGAHRALGLTDEELGRIVEILGRQPNELELAMYAVMWSEHCSYKSSRVHLARLPTTGPQVLVGPGENAGVLDVGDGLAVAVRIESHNHPSAVEPYQGAATGVGGIIRDIFTMGARPIALMDPLFFGPLEDAPTRYLVDGVVRGIAGYGNAVGVPTIGGQLTFDPTYLGNPLVNVFCLGVLRTENLVLASASGTGNLAVLLGARTGRDGIGGVSVLASAELGAPGEAAGGEKRPSVQVGDPFEEKRLIEACLALLDEGLVVGIQDLGGAGLACATSETAANAGQGMDVEVGAVPLREPGMSPVEVMTSESQERMLAIVRPDDLEAVRALCRRWEVDAAVIGTVADPDDDGVGRLRVHDKDGTVLAELPAASLSRDAPRYERPMAPPSDLAARRAEDPGRLAPPDDLAATLAELLIDPSFVYRQYDHQLFLNTVLGPGQADAAVLKLAAPGIEWQGKALALSADANPGWCWVDPREGTAATVAECALNISCTGARPLGLVNCLNFGNPEHPEVMWQLSEAIDGMAAACETLGIPVVGGNVSLYNAPGGADIDPTPVVAIVGLLDHLAAVPPRVTWRQGDAVVLLGGDDRCLAGSRWARLRGCRGGVLEPVDLEGIGRLCELVRGLAAAEAAGGLRAGLVGGIHDVSDGGLLVALAELAMAGGVGCIVEESLDHAALLSERPGRVLVATADAHAVLDRALSAGVPARVLGQVGGDRLVLGGALSVEVAELARTASARLRDALEAPATHS
jgi:phosphoribosylformylglycinamidine synthase II